MSLFTEDNGNFSMTRVLSLVIVIAGLSIGLVLALTGKLDANGVTLALGLVGLGYTGKVVSKGLESNV